MRYIITGVILVGLLFSGCGKLETKPKEEVEQEFASPEEETKVAASDNEDEEGTETEDVTETIPEPETDTADDEKAAEPPQEEKEKFLIDWVVDPGIRYEDASVPFAYRLDDGRVRIYHGGRGGIGSAISEDGLAFEEEATGLIEQGMLGDLNAIVSDPTVVTLDDGRVRMYYKGADGPGGPGEAIHTVYSAISEDGVNFTEEGIRVDSQTTPDRDWASVPDAVKLPDGRVRLYYVSDGLDVGHGIVCAISEDGLNFTREEPVLTGYVDPSVIMLPDERFLMLAVAFRTGPKDTLADFMPGIYYFISEDGIHFEKIGIALSGEDNIDPAIVDMGDEFYRVYYWNFQDNPNLIRSFSGRMK